MKKIIVALFMAVVGCSLAWGQGPTWTTSKIEAYNGYDYELWNQNNKGSVSMKLTGDNGSATNAVGGTFEATWSNTENVLFRSGKKWGQSGPTAAQHGNIRIDFAATWSSTDNVKMLGVYGWAYYASGSVPTKDETGTSRAYSNQIEYYIIQDRGSYNPASGGNSDKQYGEATIDGIVYEFWVADRIGQPALTGNSVNFKQYFSVPKSTSSHRTSGTISVSKHFEEWVKVGMKMDGPLYEVAMKVESYTGSGSSNGSAKVTKNLLTIGGSSTTPSSSSAGTPASSSSRPSSSSSAPAQATTCPSGNLVQYGTVPANPYTACFRYTGTNNSYIGKCYVCKVSNEADGNTCASSWIWNSVTNVNDNLAKGYWYQEVSCPAGSSSSAAVSSSSRASSSVQSSSSRATGGVVVSSSSANAVTSSSSGGVTPILKNHRIPVTYLSVQALNNKALRIEMSSPALVEIFDLNGNKATSFDVSGTSQTVELSLPNGVYFAKVHGMKSVRFVLR